MAWVGWLNKNLEVVEWCTEMKWARNNINKFPLRLFLVPYSCLPHYWFVSWWIGLIIIVFSVFHFHKLLVLMRWTKLAGPVSFWVQSPTRGLRSSSSKLLQVPHTNLRFGSRSYRVSAPTTWNSIPISVRSCESLTTFRKHLKTFYFQSAFPAAP